MFGTACAAVAVAGMPLPAKALRPLSELMAKLSPIRAEASSVQLANIRAQIRQRQAESGHPDPDEYLLALIRLEKRWADDLDRRDRIARAVGDERSGLLLEDLPTLAELRQVLREPPGPEVHRYLSLLRSRLNWLEYQNPDPKLAARIHILKKLLNSPLMLLEPSASGEPTYPPIPMPIERRRAWPPFP